MKLFSNKTQFLTVIENILINDLEYANESHVVLMTP